MTSLSPSELEPPTSDVFRRAEAWRFYDLLFWSGALAFFFLFPDHLLLGSQILILGLFALSLDLLLGYAGIISFGHAAFFGIGAYTAGLLAKHGWGEPVSGLLLAGIVAAAAGFVSSIVVTRTQGLALIVVTLSISLLVFELANRMSDITGGEDGLQGISMDALLGLFEFDLYGRTGFVYCLVVAFLLFLIARRIVHSPFGLALRGMRENVDRVPALGGSIRWHSAAIYTVAAAYAGIAGALLAQTTQFVGLDALSMHRSAEVLIVLVIGGAGSIYGGFVGAAFFLLFRDFVASVDPQYWYLWMGLMLVALVLLGRNGLVGVLDSLYEMVVRRLRPTKERQR